MFAQNTQNTQSNLPACSTLISCDATSSAVMGYIQLCTTVNIITTTYGPSSHYTVVFNAHKMSCTILLHLFTLMWSWMAHWSQLLVTMWFDFTSTTRSQLHAKRPGGVTRAQYNIIMYNWMQKKDLVSAALPCHNCSAAGISTTPTLDEVATSELRASVGFPGKPGGSWICSLFYISSGHYGE